MWFLLSIDYFPMTSTRLSFRSGIYSIMHIFLSISAQLCCKIKILYFWVNLNARPNFVIVENLYWPSALQDTNTNHAYGFIVLFRNLPTPYLVGPVKDSWRYILSPLLSSECMWQCFHPIWPCPVFSIIFHDKCLTG